MIGRNSKRSLLMKTIVLLFIVVFTQTIVAQHAAKEKELILYDPSFWQQELKLKHFQYQQMQIINHEFYEQLVSAFRIMHDDKNAFRSAYALCWADRTTQLWDTMNARQRRRWRKMRIAKHIDENSVQRSIGFE